MDHTYNIWTTHIIYGPHMPHIFHIMKLESLVVSYYDYFLRREGGGAPNGTHVAVKQSCEHPDNLPPLFPYYCYHFRMLTKGFYE